MKNKIIKKAGTIAVAVITLLAMKLYNKSSNSSEYEKQLLALCEQNSNCITSVHENFNSCFESSYSLGSKRRKGGLKFEKFVECMNSKSEQPYFSVDPEYQG
jgi:hypothetical protein